MTATLHPFSLALTDPFQTASTTITRREGFVLELSAGEHTGLGEATPLPPWTESFRACELALTAARSDLEAGDYSAARTTCASYPAARHAVDLAAHDLHARRAGVPLSEYLGGSTEVERVPVNATIAATTESATVTDAQTAVEDGYETLKFKAGTTSPTDDAHRVRAVTKTLPPNVSVRVDANGAWSLEDATTFLETVTPVELEYLEQPLPASNLDNLAQLRDHGTPIAVDETLIDTSIEAVMAAEAANVFVLKPMVLGGIDRAHTAATTLLENGYTPVLSTTIDAAFARTAASHIAASLPNSIAAGLATGSRLTTDLVPDPPQVTSGTLPLPEGNGLGISLPTSNDV